MITGAARGIGRAIAVRLSEAGARVVVNDLDAAAVQEVASQIDGHAVVADAATSTGVRELIDAARAHLDDIDVWCGNAGIERGAGIETLESDWRASFDAHVMGHVHAARELIPGWLERGEGRLVVTASAAGLLTMLGNPAYAVTKHGSVAFAEWLSATYRHRGIHVHAICPLGVRTQMFQAAGAMKDVLSYDQVLEPEEIAEALLRAVDDGRFLVLPHPEVADYYAQRATHPDQWLRGMNRIQERIERQRELR